ncbi:hypothetical protein ACFOOM_06315 [Streptomyces echinoruber]|uniref:hypothetical protein n=1 Tax=Streptomyces echinoruber TaxID=68898 RepID=UPI00167C92FD|nr:hypothetical protein [Streptomyces echinoruber]
MSNDLLVPGKPPDEELVRPDQEAGSSIPGQEGDEVVHHAGDDLGDLGDLGGVAGGGGPEEPTVAGPQHGGEPVGDRSERAAAVRSEAFGPRPPEPTRPGTALTGARPPRHRARRGGGRIPRASQ